MHSSQLEGPSNNPREQGQQREEVDDFTSRHQHKERLEKGHGYRIQPRLKGLVNSVPGFLGQVDLNLHWYPYVLRMLSVLMIYLSIIVNSVFHG